MQILVLGMHRSGTSVVSRLLNMMGVYFAPEGAEMPAHHSNPKGFWERKDVYEQCKKLLASIECDWQRLSQFNIKALPAGAITEFREAATRIILGMDAHRPWFLKEPRMCLLAPLWLELLELPVCVFVYRSPLEVARSLETRNGFSGTFSFALWERYTISALNATLRLRRIQVNHADLMSRPVPTVRTLEKQLRAHGIQGLRTPTSEEILAFIDPALYRAREKDTSGLGKLSAAQRRLRDVCEKGTALLATKPMRFSATGQAELTRHDQVEVVQKRTANLEQSQSALAKSQKELEALRAQLAVQQRELADKERLLKAAKEEAIKNAASAEKIREALRQEMKLLRAEAKADVTNAKILEREKEIAKSNERNTALADELTKLKDGLARSNERNTALTDEVTKLKKGLESSEAASAQVRNKLDAAQKEIAAQENELAAQRNEIIERRSALKAALLESASRSDQIRGIRADLEAAREDLRSKTKGIADLTNRVKTASARTDALDATIKNQLRTLEEKDVQIAQLTQRNQILQKGLNTIEGYFARLRASRSFRFMVYTARRMRLVSRTPRRYVEAIKNQFPAIRKALKEAKPAAAQVTEAPPASAVPGPKKIEATPAEISSGKSLPLQEKQEGAPSEAFREFDAEAVDRITSQLTTPISIVIPIYNCPEELRRCVDSILLHTNTPFELILVDDHSPDPAISLLLEKYEAHSCVRVIRNQGNYGFVRSANIGVAATRCDVVLLNSDTEVTPRWLQKLAIAAYSDAKIATVTPFSNAAGAFSVPEIGVNASIPFPFTPLKMARLTERLSNRAYPEVPTGNGFCLYIKRAAWEEVGGFDEEKFGRGYGEENDFCMRARQAGWRNVIDDSLFVYHRGNSSFGEEKQALAKRNRHVLDSIHPEYTASVREFASSQPINSLRARIGRGIKEGVPQLHLNKPRILFILHHGSGGVPMTNADLVSQLSGTHQCFLLTSTGLELILSAWENDRSVEKRRWKLTGPWSAKNYRNVAARKVYFQVLTGLGIDLVHIRHLFKHSFDAPLLCRQLGIRVVLSFHDHYFVCPSIHLLDQNAVFCGGRCTPGLQQCTIPSPLLADLPMLKQYLPEWRGKVAEVFDCCDAFVTTAESVREVHLSTYPQLKQKPFWVIEHGRDFRPVDSVAAAPRPAEPARILVAGNVDHHKGSHFIRQLKDLDTEGLLEFHFFGKTDNEVRGVGVHHGAYKRDDFARLAQEIRPAFAAVFSITAESYSHTLTEAWSVGLPVLGSRLGAVGERIEKHGGGWTVDTTDPAGVLAQIRKIMADPAAYQERLDAVSGLKLQTTEDMAIGYRALYTHVLAGTTPENVVRVGAIEPRGDRGSSFIRLRLPLAHEQIQKDVSAFRLAPELSRKELEEWIRRLQLDVIVVQRDVLGVKALASLCEICRAQGIRVVFEIDDNLLEIDQSHAEFDLYSSKAKAIGYLAREADQIVVSTKDLARVFGQLNPRTAVMRNALDEWLWFGPVKAPNRRSGDGKIVAGYMGTNTHGADLNMIREPFLRARERLSREHGLELVLQLIGGMSGNGSPIWYERVQVPRGCSVYPKFVEWLRKTVTWDFAVAPLVDNALNRSKSALKFLEYTALHAPAVLSKVGEYAEVVKHRETGLLVPPETSEGWEESIVELASSPSLRQALIDRAQRQVRDHFVLRNTVHTWPSILNPAHASRRPTENDPAAERAAENAKMPDAAVAFG